MGDPPLNAVSTANMWLLSAWRLLLDWSGATTDGRGSLHGDERDGDDDHGHG